MKTFFALLSVAVVLTFVGCNTGAESKCACGKIRYGQPVSVCTCCSACPCTHSEPPQSAGECNCADDLAGVTEGAPVSECSCCAACPCSHPKNVG